VRDNRFRVAARTATVRSAVLMPTATPDSLAWMRPDLRIRLLPFTAAVLAAWLIGHPAWLGLSRGQLPVQLAFGLAGAVVFFAAACAMQRVLTPRRGSLKVPATAGDAGLQAGYYLLNAVVEEAFFRGLIQGGLGAATVPAVGLAAGAVLYVTYHRLGGWRWMDVLATSLVGVPVALAFLLLPGPPSLLGVSLVHFGATCGFLGPGPWLLRRLRLLERWT
jgi:membrane protease YdiL (CAAX protease family)